MPVRAATCPFCGLLCDDLTVDCDGAALRPVEGACSRSRTEFAKVGTPEAASASARIAGTQVSTEAALDEAATLLQRARRPFIGGLATDVAGMRAVLDLARRVGAVVDHMSSGAKYRNLHVLQEYGWITTTLAEVKNRADLVLLIGDGWHTRFPRFVERALAPQSDLTGSALQRRIALVDQAAEAARPALPEHCEVLSLGATIASLPLLFDVLGAQWAKQPVSVERMPGVDAAALVRLLEWMTNARYGVFVWAAADLDLPHAELAMQALSRLLRAINQTQRFAGLPLAGTNGDLTANAVHTWQTGAAFPASHANRQVDMDPHRYALSEVLARREADCLVWIASMNNDAPPGGHDMPSIVLGRADTQFEQPPAVFLPVATPGLDAAGHLIRSDKVVSLYLPRLRESPLLSVASAVTQLLQRLG